MGLFGGTRPSDLGVRNGRLKAPPASPNAVSSQVTEGYHAIAPLKYKSAREQAWAILAEIVRTLPRTRVISHTGDYLYAECESALLRFVDDVEFYLPLEESGLIHVRSASRLGHSDLGVNRKRVEDIRAQLESKGA